jgi:hypothetical protein
MALASSGTMSIGGIAANRSINLELGLAQNATSSMGSTTLRNLAGVASGVIQMSDFYGASASTCTSYSSTSVATSCKSACVGSVNQTYYHDGSASFPVVGDNVYSNSSCTTALSDGYYKDGQGTCVTVSSGAVTQLSTCVK